MERVEELVLEFNKTLKYDGYIKKKAAELIELAKNKFNVKIKMLDFAFYNELTQMCANDEKLKSVKEQNFEYAATQRELERKCEKFIEIRKQFKIRKTSFYYEKKYLFYFYFGKTDNERIFKELLLDYKL